MSSFALLYIFLIIPLMLGFAKVSSWVGPAETFAILMFVGFIVSLFI